MKKINELYYFEKFWKIYTRQERAVSKWDEKRTDMDVFIRRTLSKWFSGKAFQVELNRYQSFDAFFHKTPPLEYKVITKYIVITNMVFSFAQYHDLITIYFIEPHSESFEEIRFGFNEFMDLKLMKNEGDFRLLRKFYPIRKEEIKLPTLADMREKIKIQ
jgi:hypothetical protein